MENALDLEDVCAENFDIKNLWGKILSILQRETRSISFNTFINPLTPYKIDDEFFIVIAADEVVKESVESRHLRVIEQAVSNVCGKNLFLKVLLEGEPDTDVRAPKKIENGSNLKSKYIFENFIKGKSNEFAFAASVAVAEAPGETTYNPLFIYGGVGLGKTHLMHSIGNHILSENPAAKVLYTTSENLTNEFITSLKERKNQQFRDKYRKVDVLLIDDIQFLSDKEGTQEEFFHTFNELIYADKQIVITSDKPPTELKTLEERLRSRFGSGLIVDIIQPDFETRTAILEKKADIERINIPGDVLRLIAKVISSNIRELEGALNKIIAHAKLTNNQLTVELAERALQDMVNENVKRSLSPALIQEIVCNYYNISADELASKKRAAAIAYARHVSMYLMRHILDLSLVEIGDYHGGRHHSTVVYAVEQVASQRKLNEDVKRTVDELENRIRGN